MQPIKPINPINPIKSTLLGLVGLIGIVGLMVFTGCNGKGKRPAPQAPDATDYSSVVVPAFNADSAYAYAAAQMAFGPRIPGSAAARKCAAYIAERMGGWCDTVVLQSFATTLWDGSEARGVNIIGSLNPSAPKRILLAAHWDSRLWADHDPNEARRHDPVPGANDGASGSAMLMELARVMATQKPQVGVDFVFFDLEDQGQPEWVDSYQDNTWCKGSQYWAQTPHIPYYTAVYGILFDMVGTSQPRYTKEEISRHYAPGLTDKVWNVAAALGYSDVFQNKSTDPILDDHLYVNQIAGIPTIDIVQNSPECSFFTHWHTVSDDLSTINPQTLAMVARVVMTTIYADYAK
ncbi:MAG: M28 family peptidase [Bacteroidales bacterium]|nr:M28 family peptidase [Bacteroidales bacterium]